MVKIEKLDVRTYRVGEGDDALILRPMKSGRYRWGMFYAGQEDRDTNVAMECDTEKQIAEAVLAALRS